MSMHGNGGSGNSIILTNLKTDTKRKRPMTQDSDGNKLKTYFEQRFVLKLQQTLKVHIWLLQHQEHIQPPLDLSHLRPIQTWALEGINRYQERIYHKHMKMFSHPLTAHAILLDSSLHKIVYFYKNTNTFYFYQQSQFDLIKFKVNLAVCTYLVHLLI